MSTRLRGLVLQGKLEKASNSLEYRLFFLALVIMIVSSNAITRLLVDSYFFHSYQMQVQDGYKIRKETPSGAKIPTPKPKDIGPRPLQNSVLIAKNLKDISDTAAYKVADAENKSFLAAEAIKEAERILKITEDTETILQLMKDIHEQCNKTNICTHFKCLPTVSSLS